MTDGEEGAEVEGGGRDAAGSLIRWQSVHRQMDEEGKSSINELQLALEAVCAGCHLLIEMLIGTTAATTTTTDWRA